MNANIEEAITIAQHWLSGSMTKGQSNVTWNTREVMHVGWFSEHNFNWFLRQAFIQSATGLHQVWGKSEYQHLIWVLWYSMGMGKWWCSLSMPKMFYYSMHMPIGWEGSEHAHWWVLCVHAHCLLILSSRVLKRTLSHIWCRLCTIKEFIYIIVNNTTLSRNTVNNTTPSRNVGKYNLHHIWDRVYLAPQNLELTNRMGMCTEHPSVGMLRPSHPIGMHIEQ